MADVPHTCDVCNDNDTNDVHLIYDMKVTLYNVYSLIQREGVVYLYKIKQQKKIK